MNKIKCVIIDHEPGTTSTLEAYIGELDALKLVGTFHNPIDALVYLQKHHVDVIFIESVLPKITGEAFLKLVPSRPKVILLSMRRCKWQRGADENVIDCLIKPIAFEDFLQSMDRCYQSIPPEMQRRFARKSRKANKSRGPFIYLSSGMGAVKLFLNEVLFIEGVRSHVKVKTLDDEILIHQGLAAVEARLAGRGFLRIHRSLLVAASKITGLTDFTVEISEHILPVSTQYRRRLLERIRECLI